jgi:hypothetical protein
MEIGGMPDKALEALTTLKTTLFSEPVIAYLRSERTFSLIVDKATGTKEEKGGCGSMLC